MSRHPIDVVSLVFGVLFAAIGGAYLVPGVALRELWSPQLVPLVLVVLGLWLIASTLRRRGGSEDAPDQADDRAGSTDPDADDETDTSTTDEHAPADERSQA